MIFRKKMFLIFTVSFISIARLCAMDNSSTLPNDEKARNQTGQKSTGLSPFSLAIVAKYLGSDIPADLTALISNVQQRQKCNDESKKQPVVSHGKKEAFGDEIEVVNLKKVNSFEKDKQCDRQLEKELKEGEVKLLSVMPVKTVPVMFFNKKQVKEKLINE